MVQKVTEEKKVIKVISDNVVRREIEETKVFLAKTVNLVKMVEMVQKATRVIEVT